MTVATLKIIEHHKVVIGHAISGFIYNDYKKRFNDGEFVITSPVASFDIEAGTIATQSGTVYKIEVVKRAEFAVLYAADSSPAQE
jgi:hypothetical protein